MAQQTHHLHACDFITYNASSQNEQKKLMILMPLFFSYRVEKTTRSQLVATYFLIKSILKIFKLSTSVYYPCSLYV